VEATYLHHFYEASTCRPPSYSGILPIPWTAVDRLAARHGYTDDEFEVLWRLIRRMDTAFIDHFREKK